MKGRNGKEFRMRCGVYYQNKWFKVGRKYLTIYEHTYGKRGWEDKVLWRYYLDELTLDTLQVIKKSFYSDDPRRVRYVLSVGEYYNFCIIQELANGIVDWS